MSVHCLRELVQRKLAGFILEEESLGGFIRFNAFHGMSSDYTLNDAMAAELFCLVDRGHGDLPLVSFYNRARADAEKDASMSRAAYPLKLPNSIKNAAQRLAREDGVSLNQWISSAVAQKVRSVEMAATFFKQRAGGADGAAMMRFLVDAPDLPKQTEEKSTAE